MLLDCQEAEAQTVAVPLQELPVVVATKVELESWSARGPWTALP